MREMGTIALCVLLFSCSSSFIQGKDDSDPPTHLQNLPVPSTSSPPQRSSTAIPDSLSGPALLPTSSEGDNRTVADLSVNNTLSQSSNDTANSTGVQGFPTEASGPTVNSLARLNSTSVPGNLTDSQDDLSTGDNRTFTASNTTLSAIATTLLPKDEPSPSTLAPSSPSQTSFATTRPFATTSLLATTTQFQGKSSTVTTKGTSPPTTTTATVSATTTPTTTTIRTTTPITEFSSTPALAKARVDTPSELNVGDDTENSSTSMDPLLAGLVSVFVVTAAVVSLLIFLKFRHRNERPEFRRLQDLPMDDMMEDTPLSMYSY